jgi:hypothetical protein
MPSVHGYPDVTFKAGTTCATTTAFYKAVYLSSDNTVDICNTVTTLAKFIGITQEYAVAAGSAISVRVAGPSKVSVCGSCTVAAGALVGVAVGTTTANGSVLTAAGKVANTAAGSDFFIGTCLFAGGNTGSTSDIIEVMLNPGFTTGVTTTVSK